jgi:hypothetical protein
VIVFIRSGRLGNQLFQYFGLSSIRVPGERLILYGFDDLKATFSGIEALLLPRSSVAERLLVLVGSRAETALPVDSDAAGPISSRQQRDALHHLEQGALRGVLSNMVGRVREDKEGLSQREAVSRHLFGTNVYFENSRNIDLSRLRSLRFRPEVLGQAVAFLSGAGLEARAYGFLHLRLGDLGNKVPEPRWFERAIRILREHRPSLPVVVASNNREEALRLTGRTEGLVFSTLDASADLALLSLADAGVVSVGTFGWWGARLAAEHARGPFIAPTLTYGSLPERWRDLGRLEMQFVD